MGASRRRPGPADRAHILRVDISGRGFNILPVHGHHELPAAVVLTAAGAGVPHEAVTDHVVDGVVQMAVDRVLVGAARRTVFFAVVSAEDRHGPRPGHARPVERLCFRLVCQRRRREQRNEHKREQSKAEPLFQAHFLHGNSSFYTIPHLEIIGHGGPHCNHCNHIVTTSGLPFFCNRPLFSPVSCSPAVRAGVRTKKRRPMQCRRPALFHISSFFYQMCSSLACRRSSSRKSGCATRISSSTRCSTVLPRRRATPNSVTT